MNMNMWALAAAVSLGAPLAFAQVGPVKPRIVPSDVRGKTPAPNLSPIAGVPRPQNLMVVIELDVDADGKVVDARVAEPSGDRDFDERARKFYLKLRAMPAIDAQGTPVAGTVKTGFRYGTAAGTPPPPTPPSEAAIAAVEAEGARVQRMTCKDFLWEYDRVKAIARRDELVAVDALSRTSVALLMSSLRIPDERVKTINPVLGKIMARSAEQCRKQPGATYWSGVFAPLARAELGG